MFGSKRPFCQDDGEASGMLVICGGGSKRRERGMPWFGVRCVIDTGVERYLGLAQVYKISEERPGNGDEVFSLLRESTLDSGAYLDRFFDTGGEHQRDHEDREPSG
jgi:hypothetical protein